MSAPSSTRKRKSSSSPTNDDKKWRSSILGDIVLEENTKKKIPRTLDKMLGAEVTDRKPYIPGHGKLGGKRRATRRKRRSRKSRKKRAQKIRH